MAQNVVKHLSHVKSKPKYFLYTCQVFLAGRTHEQIFLAGRTHEQIFLAGRTHEQIFLVRKLARLAL